MKKRKFWQSSILVLFCFWYLVGCSKKEVTQTNMTEVSDTVLESETEPETETYLEPPSEQIIREGNWSDYFEGLNGAAVFYTPVENQFRIYNYELATTQRSPCSTFKIISSLIGIEQGIISKENSLRKWSGEIFWKEEWNKDIDFDEAFKTSCVWYFREVISDIGTEIMQEELDKLQYGNGDLSDWEGRLNTNNNNRALTGFWIESSLKISPKEQTEVMMRIFEEKDRYQEETIEELKQVMKVMGQEQLEYSIYGKTGTGKKDGITVDSWFTGFVETKEGNVFFSVYLGETEGREVSSAKAKEIALAIASDIL